MENKEAMFRFVWIVQFVVSRSESGGDHCLSPGCLEPYPDYQAVK